MTGGHDSAGRQRPRPGRPKNLERREAIISTAEIHFARYGYRGTRMDDIAKDCGLSESLVFRYFPRKIDLLGAVNQRSVERWNTLARRLAEATRRNWTTAGLLRDIGLAYAAYVHDAQANYILWFMDSDALGEPSDKLIDRAVRAYNACVAALRRMPDYHDSVNAEIEVRSFLGAIFQSVFFNRRVGTPMPNGLPTENFISELALTYTRRIVAD